MMGAMTDTDATLMVVLERPGLVVVDKPAGLLSVPGRGAHLQDCVAARVRAAFPRASGPLTVHRLDMETSGLMVVALDARTHRALSGQFERREVSKAYGAVLDGDVEGEAGVVELRQRLDVDNRPVQVVDEALGKVAVTRWRVVERGVGRETSKPVGDRLHHGARTRVVFEPVTGRSHQLRLAAATARERGGLGAAIAGDTIYGSGRASAARLLLHATRLGFADPSDGSWVEVESAAPF